jgi:hypothetical protein
MHALNISKCGGFAKSEKGETGVPSLLVLAKGARIS